MINENMTGWLFGLNIDCYPLTKKGMESVEIGDGVLYLSLSDRFRQDRVVDCSGIFLEGYIVNKDELIKERRAKNWEDCFGGLVGEGAYPENLRGSFSGFVDKFGKKVFFVDHIGSRAVFYYCHGDKMIVSTKLWWMVQILRYNEINYTLNEEAVRYMLTYGYMIDDASFVNEIKRILPGNKVSFNGKELNITNYYRPTINNVKNMTEDEAIELLDASFRLAVKREFEKDKEYGYKHLVDLSGGLDSRMVTWVAHDMGYNKQINFSYCKAQYIDHKVSSRIAGDLKHEYYFKQLDDFQWIYKIEDILKLGNGEAIYSGITGGMDCLLNFNSETYGIEHTGMLGDVIISSFAPNEKEAYKVPVFGKNQYSTRLAYEFRQNILDKYENQEVFDLYVRGFLGAMSTYAIRQNYFEVSSPFLDVDFMNACLSIPMKYRAKHRIYLKWIKKYYPNASNYGWEKWAGVKPKENLIMWRNFIFVVRKIKRIFRSFWGESISDSMNPLDYWYLRDAEAQQFFEKYFSDNINSKYISEELRKDIMLLFKEGCTEEKTQALTVLGMAKIYFEGE